jgi:serine protease Do
MIKVIEQYKKVVTQIATPYSTGTGFYLKEQGVVVTNEHVVRGNREVVVEGALIQRQMAKVVFTDPKYDLAFLKCGADALIPNILLTDAQKLEVGEIVSAIGHPFGLKFTATQGIVSNVDHKENDIQYYQHDAALNPGNSGGPLINASGHVVGVNTFIINNGENMGFSLPVEYLKNSLIEFSNLGKGRTGIRCVNCSNLVFEDTVEGQFCPHCGSKIKLPNQEEEYEAAGVPFTIEEILEKCGHEIKLSRRGPCLWEVVQGSAKIFVTYYEPNGLIAGDAILCILPQKNIMAVYEYLLRENNNLEGLTLSIKGQEVVLSLIIYDRFLSADSGLEMFQRLFQKADDLDNILVEEFGCSWKE